MCSSMHHKHVCGGQRTPWESQFSTSTMWVPRFERSRQACVESTFIHWTVSMAPRPFENWAQNLLVSHGPVLPSSLPLPRKASRGRPSPLLTNVQQNSHSVETLSISKFHFATLSQEKTKRAWVWYIHCQTQKIQLSRNIRVSRPQPVLESVWQPANKDHAFITKGCGNGLLQRLEDLNLVPQQAHTSWIGGLEG